MKTIPWNGDGDARPDNTILIPSSPNTGMRMLDSWNSKKLNSFEWVWDS
jgi:hypothetical protein